MPTALLLDLSVQSDSIMSELAFPRLTILFLDLDQCEICLFTMHISLALTVLAEFVSSLADLALVMGLSNFGTNPICLDFPSFLATTFPAAFFKPASLPFLTGFASFSSLKSRFHTFFVPCFIWLDICYCS